MESRAHVYRLLAIALLGASGCGDDASVKPRVVDLASNRAPTEDGGSGAAVAATQPTTGDDVGDPTGPVLDDGSEIPADPREAAGNKGSLPQESINEVFARGTPAVKKCYERELKRTPALAGRMIFGIKIGRTGKVDSVRLKASTLKNKVVERCIVTAIKKWKFPKPAGGSVQVTYPISFSPKGT